MVGERKVRSDKKFELKPLLPIALKDIIYRVSYITQTPIKDICEWLTIEVISNQSVMDDLAIFFKRDLRYNSTLYRGDFGNRQIKKRIDKEKGKVTIKFKREEYDFICELAHALDVRPTRCVAIILEIALRDMRVVERYVNEYVVGEFTVRQEMEMRAIEKALRK